MPQWMDRWLADWVDKWIDDWMREWTDRQVAGLLSERLASWVD